jgi:hypothetical protein
LDGLILAPFGDNVPNVLVGNKSFFTLLALVTFFLFFYPNNNIKG